MVNYSIRYYHWEKQGKHVKNANSPYFLCQYFLKSQQFFVIYYILLLDVIFMLVQKFILPYIKALGFGAPPAWPHRPKSSTARLPLPSRTSTRSVRQRFVRFACSGLDVCPVGLQARACTWCMLVASLALASTCPVAPAFGATGVGLYPDQC